MENKPCPFCGGDPNIEEGIGYSRDYGAMVCNCGAEGPSVKVVEDDGMWVQEAIDGWNSRIRQWISVNDRLPEIMEPVMSYGSDHGIRTSYFGMHSEFWDDPEGSGIIIKPTHWMPLPEPPVEEDE